MSSALTIPNSGLPAHAPKTAYKKAAKKDAGHHPPKTHLGPGHEHKHDAQADLRRAYLHLARASSILEVLPKSGALNELKKLYSFCEKLFDAANTSPKPAAESARALEHLCFVSLGSTFSSIAPVRSLPRELKRDFERHFRQDFEKQKEHLEEYEDGPSQRGKGLLSQANALLDMARQSLATAERMLKSEDWYLAHECLRATDGITKALDHLS
jgi:hypothetical protein